MVVHHPAHAAQHISNYVRHKVDDLMQLLALSAYLPGGLHVLPTTDP